jgi:hypothetical protein
MWKSAVLGEIICDGHAEFGMCEVDVVVTYQGFNMRGEMKTILKEIWVQVDGDWYTSPRL